MAGTLAQPVRCTGIELAANGPGKRVGAGGSGFLDASGIRAMRQVIASLVFVGASIFIHCRT